MMNMANVKDRFLSAVLIIFLAISTTDVQGKSLSLRIVSVKGESPCQTGLIHQEDAFVVTGRVTTENINASDSQRVQFTIVGTNFEATVCTVRLSSCHEQDSSYMGCYCQNTGEGDYDVVLRQKANVQYSSAKVKMDYKDDDFSFEMSSTSWRIPETFYKDTEKLKLEANGIKVDLTSSQCTLPLREGQNTFMYCCSDAPSCDVKITEPDGRESGSIGCYKLTAYGIDESLHYAFSYSVCGVESSQSYTCKGKFAPELFPTSPPPPPLDHDADDEEVSKEPVGIGIILGVVAAVIVPLVIILGVCFYCKRHGNKIGCCPEKGNSENKTSQHQNEMGQKTLAAPPSYDESQSFENEKKWSSSMPPKSDTISNENESVKPTSANCEGGPQNARKSKRQGSDNRKTSQRGYNNHTDSSNWNNESSHGNHSVKVDQIKAIKSPQSVVKNNQTTIRKSFQGDRGINLQPEAKIDGPGHEGNSGQDHGGCSDSNGIHNDRDKGNANDGQNCVSDKDKGKVESHGKGSCSTDQQPELNTDNDQGSGDSGDGSGIDKDKDKDRISACSGQSSDSDNGQSKVGDIGKSGSGTEPQSETSTDESDQKPETKPDRLDNVDDSDQGSEGSGGSSGIEKDKDSGNANSGQSCVSDNN